ncbi:MAG: TonB-dependent receptor [Acidobacteria bacterium]|nr:TonB-dependent receptor [Acidobacteriota bacterium]
MRRAAALPLWVCSLFAQRQTGELRVSVVDATGAALEASGELASDVNQVRQRFRTDLRGRYTARELPFGPYRLVIERPGFAAYSRLLEIRSEAPAEERIALGIAPLETAISIADSGTLLDPRRAGTLFHLGPETLASRAGAPPARGALQLVSAQPGWVLEANGVLHPRGSEYDTQYVIDGIPVLDNRSPAFAPAIEVEELEAMRILTSNYPAEYGRKLGGVIEVAIERDTRPGLHGRAVVQGGSFDTQAGHVSAQYSGSRWAAGANVQGAHTARFLDPPVEQNFSNRYSGGGASARLEATPGERDRLRFYVHQKRGAFLAPNELAQQQAGQRQDRDNSEVMGQLSWQRVLSPRWLADFRGMGRELAAGLWSNPRSTPILAAQDRSFRETYLSGAVSADLGRHALKFGSEAILTRVRERFAYAITDRSFFDDDLPPRFDFADRAHGREHSAYLQDLIRAGDFTFSAGLRWDRYQLVVRENFLSPRLGAAWHLPPAGLVLRASYDRAVTIPAIENLLLASSPAAQRLTDETTGLPLRPSRGSFYEAGFSKSLFGKLRLDAAHFRRNVRHFADDDVFLNTGVSFPISFERASIHGFEAKLEAPRLGRWSGYASWSNLVGTGHLPVTGGLFLEEEAAELLSSRASFPISQDQRNTWQTRWRFEAHPRLWLAAGAWYASGLPVELGDFREDELQGLFGPRVPGQVDFARGKVKPSHSLDLSLGATIWEQEQRRSIVLQADLLNATNRLNVINFAGLFSGTAIGAPRSFSLRLRAEF